LPNDSFIRPIASLGGRSQRALRGKSAARRVAAHRLALHPFRERQVVLETRNLMIDRRRVPTERRVRELDGAGHHLLRCQNTHHQNQGNHVGSLCLKAR
jgi:hypothetical protein